MTRPLQEQAAPRRQIERPPVQCPPAQRPQNQRTLVRHPLFRRTVAWLAGSVVAYVLASLAHTQTILAGLTALGVEIGWRERLSMSLGDLIGLHLYGVVIGAALAIGLSIMFLIGRRLGPATRYALAGAIAVATALLAMRLAFSITPIASAREPFGFALQCLAGAAGGWAYAHIRRLTMT